MKALACVIWRLGFRDLLLLPLSLVFVFVYRAQFNQHVSPCISGHLHEKPHFSGADFCQLLIK